VGGANGIGLRLPSKPDADPAPGPLRRDQADTLGLCSGFLARRGMLPELKTRLLATQLKRTKDCSRKTKGDGGADAVRKLTADEQFH
jgi:hypothetical protein